MFGRFHIEHHLTEVEQLAKLIHRTEADVKRLFKASKFGRPCDEIRFEAERVNLFAIGYRGQTDR